MKPRVLIGEDSDLDAGPLIQAFTLPPPWDVVHLRTGLDVLGYLRREGRYRDAPRPNLLVINVRLPQLDGLEILEEMKSSPRLRSIPVVIWSTCDAQKNCIDEAYRRGASLYLAKPPHLPEARRQALALRRLLDMVRFPSPK